MVTVSFPGLGIENFTLKSTAFTIPIFGGLAVRWYGLIITLGILLAFTYCAYRAKQEEISFDQLLDIAIYTIIFGIIGARAYYVLTSLDKFDSFYSVIAIWEGGLAIYGGIIAGALTIWLVCRHKKIKPLKMLDAVSPAVMIGQILGRWGNFFNGEAHGGVVAEGSPLYFLRMGLYPHHVSGVPGMAYVHPTFLYESVWNLIGFVLIHLLYKKKKFDGQVLLMYLGWYGFGRMFIEGLRTDSLMVGPFRISQVLGFVCFATSAILLTVFLIRAKKAKEEEEEYTPAYGRVTNPMGTAAPTEEKPREEAKIVSDESCEEALDATVTEDEPEAKERSYSKEEKEELRRRIADLFDDNTDDIP